MQGRCTKSYRDDPQILCAKRCCLPADHGPSFHHCCRDHLQYRGRMSQDEMASWRMFSWGHRVITKARRLATATYRLMSKWRIVQLAIVGAMLTLWLAVQTGPVASQLSQDQKYIICSTHGALFEIEDGLCVSGPCRNAYLKPVMVSVEESSVLIEGNQP